MKDRRIPLESDTTDIYRYCKVIRYKIAVVTDTMLDIDKVLDIDKIDLGIYIIHTLETMMKALGRPYCRVRLCFPLRISDLYLKLIKKERELCLTDVGRNSIVLGDPYIKNIRYSNGVMVEESFGLQLTLLHKDGLNEVAVEKGTLFIVGRIRKDIKDALLDEVKRKGQDLLIMDLSYE